MSSNMPGGSSPSRNDLIEAAIAEYLEAIDRVDESFDQQEWLSRYETVRSDLVQFLESEREVGRAISQPSSASSQALDATIDMPSDLVLSSSKPANRPATPRSRIGNYQLKRLLGSGGMGHVYEAMDPNGNLVALKILSHQWTQSSESLRRFKLEGRIASTINHPRCVFVKAADEDKGVPYIVMELMTGKTLKDLSQESGQLPVSKAVRAIMDVLDGLEEAHNHGMIHRDIKPGNCYLESSGRIKLGDFGLARSVEDSSDLTRTGEFVGTPLFASPEQVKGHAIDTRTDIYSVCATLYFMLTGQAPFAGSSPTSVIAKIVSEDPVSIRSLNPEVPILLERIVMRGLQRDPKLRYQTVAELKQALGPFVTGRQSIATWGRRFAAYGLDSTVTGTIGILSSQLLTIDEEGISLPLSHYLWILFPVVVYHFLFEGIGWASPGKMLLRLQIADRKTGERPSRSRILFRTTVALLLMGVGGDLLLYAFVGKASAISWMTMQWIGYLISYSIILLPVLVARRYRLLFQDWISGTMVIDRVQLSSQQLLSGAAGEYKVPVFSSTAYPAQLGEYQVEGVIFANSKECVLSAKDESLGRTIWIWIRPGTEPELSLTRRTCDRSTRLRWLSNGRLGDKQWDAFLATRGAPLKYWSTPDSPLLWRESRGFLSQIVEELKQSSEDNTTIPIQSLDQVWLDSRGRIVLIDWTSLEMESAESHAAKENKLDHRGFLAEVARLTLCGKSMPISSNHPPIPALVPLHVRELLGSLTSSGTSSQPFSLDGFRNALVANAHLKTEPTFENRLLGLGILLLPGLLLVGMIASLARIGNQLILEKITDQLVTPVAVQWLLEENHWEEFSQSIGSVDFPKRDELAEWQAGGSERQARLVSEYSLRFSGLHSIAKLLAMETNLIENPADQLKEVVIEVKGASLVAVNWKKKDRRTDIDAQLLTRIVRHPSDASPLGLLRRQPNWLVGISLFPYLLWIVWGGVTGGGISMWVSGLRVVRRDGRRAWIGVHFVRLLVAMLPFMLLQAFVVWNDLHRPESLWISSAAYQVLLLLCVVYAILMLAFPKRAPHDWLLGTSLVTK